MKLKLLNERQREELVETFDQVQSRLWEKPLPLRIFLALCLNVLLAEAVLAADTGNSLGRGNAYAIGLLGLVTVGLAAYLLVVMFQPQRF
jgi:K+-transporting ATPase KdpF subunit